MNKVTKFFIGLLTWQFGALIFAWAAYYAPDCVTDGCQFPTAPESTYWLISMAYLIGVPIITGVWIYDDEAKKQTYR